jgi:flagellar basal-body rod modification protein FlgD
MTINTNNTASTASTASNTAATSASTLSGSMSQADFLKLMTAQLQAQDPTNPVDNSQFVSQMAQFSQLSATQGIQTSLDTLSTSLNSATQTSQVLSSSNLVDRQVLVPASTIAYSGSAVTGAANMTGTGDLTVNIMDASGNVVRSIDEGSQNTGLAQFSWDGKDNSGNALPQGSYTMSASSGGASLDTYLGGKVTAVGYGGTSLGTYLQVAGVGGVALSQVAQIL